MAYRIIYGPMPRESKENRAGFGRIQTLTAIFVLLFVLLVRHISPEGTELLRSFLLPGEPTVTQQAFAEMVTGLQEGAPVGETLTAFCKQIIDDGTQLLH